MATESYEWVLSGILGGQFVQTVQHVQCEIATPVNPFATALAIAQEFTAPGNVLESFMACLPSDYQATSIRVRRVLPTGGATAILVASDFGMSQVGMRTGQISSAQVNPLIVWIRTLSPEDTGRLFLPGVSEDDIDEMMLNVSLVAAINQFCAEYALGGTIGGVDSWKGAVLVRQPPPGPATPVLTDPIFAGQVSPLIGTQRRRLRPV